MDADDGRVKGLTEGLTVADSKRNLGGKKGGKIQYAFAGVPTFFSPSHYLLRCFIRNDGNAPDSAFDNDPGHKIS